VDVSNLELVLNLYVNTRGDSLRTGSESPRAEGEYHLATVRLAPDMYCAFRRNRRRVNPGVRTKANIAAVAAAAHI